MAVWIRIRRSTGLSTKTLIAVIGVAAVALLAGCGGGGDEGIGLTDARALQSHPLGEFAEVDNDVFVNIRSMAWKKPLEERTTDHVYTAVLQVRIENRSDNETPGLYFGMACDAPDIRGSGIGGTYDGSQPLPAKSFFEGEASVRFPGGCFAPRVRVTFYLGGLGGRDIFFPIEPPPSLIGE